VLKACFLTRGKVFIHRDEVCFSFIPRKNIYESTRGEYMFYENNIKMLDYFFKIKKEGAPIFDFTSDKNVLKNLKDKYEIKDNYRILNITASESFKYASYLVWQEVFDLIDLSIKTEKDSVFKNKQIIITGEPKDKIFLDKLSLNKNYIKRLDGKLSFRENTELILGAEGLLTMRTGAATLATMLPISYKVLAIVPLVCHNWDYDYYKNIIKLRAGENCLCSENGHKECLQKYEDNVYRTRCVGDIKPSDILNNLKEIFA
jgi:ADP-heptose:LPS heptosyltransferase